MNKTHISCALCFIIVIEELKTNKPQKETKTNKQTNKQAKKQKQTNKQTKMKIKQRRN